MYHYQRYGFTGGIEAFVYQVSGFDRMIKTLIQFLPHPDQDFGRFKHIMAFHIKMPLYYPLADRRMTSMLGVHEYRRGLNARSLDEKPIALITMLYSPAKI